MSVGAILTLGFGQFGGVNLLPTLGYRIGSTPPVPPTVDTATPGFLRRLPFSGVRGETEEEKRERRIREGSIPAPSLVSDDGRLAQYTEKSAKVMAAIAKLRRETEAVTQESLALRSRIEQAKRAKARERLEHELLLKEQALTLARVQEVALLEELTVIDIAYVSVIAIGVIIQ